MLDRQKGRTKSRAFSDEMESVRAASSVDSPPPCGEGLGVGVVQCGDAAPNRATPPPQPSSQRGEGADRVPRAAVHQSHRAGGYPAPALADARETRLTWLLWRWRGAAPFSSMNSTPPTSR